MPGSDILYLSRNQKIFIFLVFVSVFVNSWVLFKSPFEFYIGYILFFISFPFFIPKYGIPKNLFIVFSILFLAGLSNVLYGNNEMQLLLKVFFGTFFSYLFYYYVLKEWKFNLEFLFKAYLKGAYIISIIAIVQLVSYIVGFKWGYDYSWLLNKWAVVGGGGISGIRINAVFGEPSQYADTISAAAFVAIYDLIKGSKGYYYSRIKAAIIIFAFMTTYSSVGYLAIIMSIMLLFFQFGFVKYALVSIFLSVTVFSAMYNNLPEFRDRIDSQLYVFQTGEFEVGKQNGSSIIQYNNFHVAVENFKENMLFGGGLGSHPVAFEKYSITKHIEIVGFDLNSNDANSMLFRLISETGLFGLILFLFISVRCFVPRKMDININGPNSFRWILSTAIMVMIFVKLVRQGHYFLNGFPLFFLMYYYNFKQYLVLKAEYKLGGTSTKEIE